MTTTSPPSSDGETSVAAPKAVEEAETATTDEVPPSSTLNRKGNDNSPPPKLWKKKKGKNGVKNSKKKPLVPPPERRKKSLIRKRPVTFGNPALGTYHGCVYTLDEVGQDLLNGTSSRPIIEGAESVERVVAMVDVPPEEVPEGVLNLARSHRPYLYHVRIVIAESKQDFDVEGKNGKEKNNNNQHHHYQMEHNDGNHVSSGDDLMESTDDDVGGGQEETKEENPLFVPDTSHNTRSGNQVSTSMLDVSAAENAASILAADQLLTTKHKNQQPTNGVSQRLEGPSTITAISNGEKSTNGNHNVSSRTYLVLLELCSVEAAENFVEDLNDKPYTSLDPTQKCSVHQVLALTGEDGVSLLSPFFAPTAKTTTKVSPKSSASSSNANQQSSSTTSKSSISTGTTSTTKTPKSKGKKSKIPAPIVVEDYNCAVCLEHMNLSGTSSNEDEDNGESSSTPSSILSTVCNHTFHLDCLLQWQDSPCPVCRYDHSGLNEALSQCNLCGRTENNYVCLICGVVSCGGPPIRSQGTTDTSSAADGVGGERVVCGAVQPPRSVSTNNSNNNNLEPPPPLDNSRLLSQSHARKHYDETLHAYALDTETQHVWDFAGQGYVHRLLQNKEDGKLVEVHDPSNLSSNERSLNPGLSDAQEGEVVHRKLEGFASQYYTLLKSQLEQQRTYYQGRLQELRRESLMRKKAQTSDLIHALKQEKAQLSRRLGSLKGRHRKVVDDIAFLKNMNESLEANKEPFKRKVRDAQRLRNESRDQIQQCIPVLEQKVTQLMLQLTGETAFVEESAAAAASHTDNVAAAATGTNPKTLKHSDSNQSDDRKPAAKR